jgi:hypothetical protein
MNTTDTLKNSLTQWQEYAQAYTDFVFDATEQALSTSLALRERADKLAGEAFKQAQALAAQEQELFLGAAEAQAAQFQAASKRVAKLFNLPQQS